MLNANQIEYLALEGGGGKGAAYLGSIMALEEVNLLPIKNNGSNKIKGIVGTSAGSITALLLALGADSLKLFSIITRGDFNQFLTLDDGIKYKARSVDKSGEIGVFDSYDNGDNRTKDFEYTINQITDIVSKNPLLLGRDLKLSETRKSILDYAIDKTISLVSESPELTKQISRDEKPDDYLHNILTDKGLFSGLSIRQAFWNILIDFFYEDIIEPFINNHVPNNNLKKSSEVLPPKFYIPEIKDNNQVYSNLRNPKSPYSPNGNTQAYDIKKELKRDIELRNDFINSFTFEKLKKKYGIDFIICGTNLSKKESNYFSNYHTPNFPVLEAVGLSMSIPVLFKPLKSEYVPAFDKFKKYAGWYCDGGVINNFPIHTFNLFINNKVDESKFQKSKPENLLKEPLNKNVFGLILDDPFKVSSSNIKNTMDVMFATLDCLMYYSGKGVFNSENVINQTVFLDTKNLGVYNFTPSLLDVCLTVPRIYNDTIKKLKQYNWFEKERRTLDTIYYQRLDIPFSSINSKRELYKAIDRQYLDAKSDYTFQSEVQTEDITEWKKIIN